MRIKELRQEKEMKQKELAAAIGITHGAISQYETGRSIPSQALLVKFAKFFNVSVDYLLGLTDEKNAAPIIPQKTREEEEESELFELSARLNANELKIFAIMKTFNEKQIDELSEYVDFMISKRENKE